MQIGTPDSVRGSARKRSLGFCAVAHETNTAERIRFTFGNRDAELAQSLHSVGHQSLATGLVNRRNRAIRQHHTQTTTARCDSRCQTARSATNYEYIHRIRKTTHHTFLIDSYHSSKTNSEQNPGPIAASKPSVPGSGRRFFMTSSSTTSTEADDKFPVLRKHCQETSSSPFFKPSASAVSSRIFGPPVCSAQLPMSARINPRSARKSSRSRARFFRTRSGISRERTIRKPFSDTSQPIISSVFG